MKNSSYFYELSILKFCLLMLFCLIITNVNSIVPTVQCFDIQNKNICGNVLLYTVNTSIGSNLIAVQSGTGFSNAKQLAEKTKQKINVKPIVLGGLDVILAVKNRVISLIKRENFYETNYNNVVLCNALKNIESGNWHLYDKLIALEILDSLITYSSSLNNIDWGQRYISNSDSKRHWVFILETLKNNCTNDNGISDILSFLNNLIPAMARGTGLRGRVHPTLDCLVEQLTNLLHIYDKNYIQNAILWGRYALHTEPQVEALTQIGLININFQYNSVPENFGRVGNVYSLYNPCNSCQTLNWIIIYGEVRNRPHKFLFCNFDRSYPQEGLGYEREFAIFQNLQP